MEPTATRTFTRISRLRRLAHGLAAVLAVLAICAAPSAMAWGRAGHELIATLAERQLAPAARSEIGRLLALEFEPGLAAISTWADEHRSDSTAAWHYVNLAPDAQCRYLPGRDCPDGQCVVEAVSRQIAVLRGRAAPDGERLQALRYVVHLVADAHQPLHAGRASDKGGNLHQLRAFGRGTNLHALWDRGLIESRPGGPARLAADLARQPAGDAATVKASAATWVEESCRIVAGPGFYPNGHTLPPGYPRRFDAVLTARLALAAARLTDVLNASLGPAR